MGTTKKDQLLDYRRWILTGLTVGLMAGLATRSTVRKLSQSTVSDSSMMYASVVLFFLAVTLIAAYTPVRRASRMDPATALRCE